MNSSTINHKVSSIKYILLSILGGIYVGIGVIVTYSVGSQLIGEPHQQIAMGLSFGIALGLITIVGAELFTGNILKYSTECFNGRSTMSTISILGASCYIGNWVGSIIITILFIFSGLFTGEVAEFIYQASIYKMNIPWNHLFIRGVFCNFIVCLAILCGTKLNNESAKIMMIIYCIFTMVSSGFEHSIANMTLLSMGQFIKFQTNVFMEWELYFKHIGIVTGGNIIGGLCAFIPYFIISYNKPNTRRSNRRKSSSKYLS